MPRRRRTYSCPDLRHWAEDDDKSVDGGGGWLIFGLPPSEGAFHPSDGTDYPAGKHEFYLLTDDLDAFIAGMGKHGVACSDVHKEPWGRLVEITLPGGTGLGVYQPHHERPPSVQSA